jgi:hypothetical protein
MTQESHCSLENHYAREKSIIQKEKELELSNSKAKFNYDLYPPILLSGSYFKRSYNVHRLFFIYPLGTSIHNGSSSTSKESQRGKKEISNFSCSLNYRLQIVNLPMYIGIFRHEKEVANYLTDNMSSLNEIVIWEQIKFNPLIMRYELLLFIGYTDSYVRRDCIMKTISRNVPIKICDDGSVYIMTPVSYRLFNSITYYAATFATDLNYCRDNSEHFFLQLMLHIDKYYHALYWDSIVDKTITKDHYHKCPLRIGNKYKKDGVWTLSSLVQTLCDNYFIGQEHVFNRVPKLCYDHSSFMQPLFCDKNFIDHRLYAPGDF